MKPRGLSHADVETFYDAFGARQDGAGYYEDVTLAELKRFANFESATSIVEFGCGTGSLCGRDVVFERGFVLGLRYQCDDDRVES
ncbi:MAG: hypothetical protein IPJ47_16905 [Anaerolineales bacterium]|nr:hypothetical protein [Anaerolineales bacterium]